MFRYTQSVSHRLGVEVKCNLNTPFSFVSPYEARFKDKTVTELHASEQTIPKKYGGCS